MRWGVEVSLRRYPPGGRDCWEINNLSYQKSKALCCKLSNVRLLGPKQELRVQAVRGTRGTLEAHGEH